LETQSFSGEIAAKKVTILLLLLSFLGFNAQNTDNHQHDAAAQTLQLRKHLHNQQHI
jgi:hypothetical protein